MWLVHPPFFCSGVTDIFQAPISAHAAQNWFGFRFQLQILLFYLDMASLVLGNRVVLARPAGIRATGAGSPLFRAVFMAFGAGRVPRTNLFQLVGAISWSSLQSSCARMYLFLTFSSATAVGTPPRALSAPPGSDADGSDADEVSDDSDVPDLFQNQMIREF